MKLSRENANGEFFLTDTKTVSSLMSVVDPIMLESIHDRDSNFKTI